jgi:hypothetical protein
MVSSNRPQEWKPPDDDGGVSVSHYIVEKCDKSMGGRWTVVGEAEANAFKVKVPL